MKGNLWKAKNTEREFTIITTEISTKDNGKMISSVEVE